MFYKELRSDPVENIRILRQLVESGPPIHYSMI